MKAALIDYTKAPDRPVDYISVAESIAQSYPDPLIDGMDSTTHGVQKDAIQNGWDARRSKKSVVNFRFELARNSKGTFLLMQDDGSGLTGKVWTRDKLDKLDEQGKELPEDERWARFESFGFMREAAGGIGSRGQGKFLFIHASEKNEILYETLLDDGTYRLGATKAFRTKCPPLHWVGRTARGVLKDQTGLAPIGERGTRVIICDVNSPTAKAIRAGLFMRAIEETWWRNIQKGRAAVVVSANGKETTAQVPAVYPISTVETKGPPKFAGSDVKTWRPDLRKLPLPGGGRFKTFELCYRNDMPVPDELRGVAVLHYGMKVVSIEPQYLPREVADGIYGFVELDEAVDEELRRRENQKPNHYDLIWSRILPRTIRQIIRDQIDEFARAKLGQGKSPQQKAAQLQADAEEKALRELIDTCKQLGIELTLSGPISPKPPPPPPPPRPLGVMFHRFAWPKPPTRRVEHGERVEFDLLLFNTTATAYQRCRLVAHVFAPRGGHSLRSVADTRVNLLSHAQNVGAGHYKVTFDDSTFPPGEYVVRATLLDQQGYELDSQGVHVFVAQDPPFRAPFELVGTDWSGVPDWRNVTHTFSPTPEPKVTYNYKHPRYADAEGGGSVTELAFYLYGLLVQASIQFALYLGRTSPKGYANIFNGGKITSSDPYDIAEDIHRVQGLLMASWK